jgi:hypothetical protein
MAANGTMTSSSVEKTAGEGNSSPRVVIEGKTGRILCIADIRGDCEYPFVSLSLRSMFFSSSYALEEVEAL